MFHIREDPPVFSQKHFFHKQPVEGVYPPVCTGDIQKILEIHVCCCVGVYVGKCLLTSCERIIQKKTLIPFDLNTIQLDALLQ